jgi:hypothetical protein
MYIATLDREKKRRPPASWMEIGVESQANPAVVTRFLAEETKQGPGKLLKVIVQVSGYSPFNVPKKYFEGSDAQVSPTVSAQVVKSLEKRSVSAGKRRVEAWEVEAEDSRGSRTRAIVSDEVFPIGLVEAENGDIRMELLEWGKDASTRITGRPRAFALWILEQIANEMGKTPSP